MSDAPRLPLPTLLSHALVAFTIEVDNEFERRMPHTTTVANRAGQPPQGPWLVSLVMWSNCLRLIDDDGTPVRVLTARSGATKATPLGGMERWGYVTVRPGESGTRRKPPLLDWIVRRTAAGVRADEIWTELVPEIESRWRARFGDDSVDGLRRPLRIVLDTLDVGLPHYLPIVTGDLFTPPPEPLERVRPAELDLSALLSQVLLTFTLDAERAARLPLPVAANTLRVLDERPASVGDLPRQTGLAKESVTWTLKVLQRRDLATVEPDPTSPRGQHVRLTDTGREAQATYARVVAAVETQWHDRFGTVTVDELRTALEPLVGPGSWRESPLTPWLAARPGGWRAGQKPPETLPHHPTVLHRGGYPDGA